MEIRTIQSGLPVVLQAYLEGGVYNPENEEIDILRRVEILRDRAVDENQRAIALRNRAITLIRDVCVETVFGLQCPTSNEDMLADRIAKVRKLVDRHNAEARHTRVKVHVIVGRIERATRHSDTIVS